MDNADYSLYVATKHTQYKLAVVMVMVMGSLPPNGIFRYECNILN